MRRMGIRAASIGVALAAACASASAGPVQTVHFDIFDNGLGIFGLQYTVDYATTVGEVRSKDIVETRIHWEFSTDHAFGNLADAATIAMDFQAPINDIARIWNVTGADLGWSGTGSFVGDLSTDYLNDQVLDFPGSADGDFALWFMRLYNTDDAQPLGGVFTNSYIEVDLVPEPASIALVGLGALCLLRRRR